MPISGHSQSQALGSTLKSNQGLGGGSGRVPAHILQAVQQASARTGVSFAYLIDKAGTESSFNPNAKASTSSASGLYQFIESTWLDMVDKHGAKYGLSDQAAAITRTKDGKPMVASKAARQDILELRKDPKVAALMAAEFAKDNKQTLEKNLGRSVGETELYLSHFLGATGATRFLKAMERNPSASAASLLPEAASANRSVFFASNGSSQTLAQIYNRFDSKFDDSEAYVADAAAAALIPAVADSSESLAYSRQPGAVPGAAMPLFSTHLLAAIDSGEERQFATPNMGSIGVYDLPVMPRPAFEGFA